MNPKLIKEIAKIIMMLATAGVQIFIASHSMFLLSELQILKQTEFSKISTKFISLIAGDDSVTIKQGDALDEIGDYALLDEDISQTQRYMDAEYEMANHS